MRPRLAALLLSLAALTVGTRARAACDADFGATSASACPTYAAPTCVSGACESCAAGGGTSACAGPSHAGPVCTSSGACGLGCSKDVDCTGTGFCDPLTLGCTAKLADGASLPVGDTCDAVTAKRECATAVCDPATNVCGPPVPASAKDGGAGGAASSDSGADTVLATFTTGGGCSASAPRPRGDLGAVLGFSLVAAALVRSRVRSRARSNARSNQP